MTHFYEDWKPLGLKLICTGTVFLIAELIYRSCLVIKELIFNKRLYPRKAKLQTIIQNAFYYKFAARFCHIAVLVLLTYVMTHTEDFVEKILQEAHLVPVYLLFRCLRLAQGRIDQAEGIRAGNGLDYATGMASNYFHGYLYLALPNWGTDQKGIRERIADYEDKHQVTFALNRLIIVIPDSLHTAPEIESPHLEKAMPLEVVMKGRAGVKRPFQNDVYKFTETINHKIYYIALEGATPLVSFKESMSNSLTGTPDMKAMRREILMQFYKSVKKFTSECEYTQNECEIVYFPDYDENGQRNDIGLYLKNYIAQRLSGRH